MLKTKSDLIQIIWEINEIKSDLVFCGVYYVTGNALQGRDWGSLWIVVPHNVRWRVDSVLVIAPFLINL